MCGRVINRIQYGGNIIMSNKKEVNETVTEEQIAALEAEAVKEEAEAVDKHPEHTKEDSEGSIAIPGTTVTMGELEEYKKQYKKVFLTDYMGSRYLWHRLNRKTFGEICDATEDIKEDEELLAAREKAFVKACVIYPEAEQVAIDVEDEMIASRISREILYKSGFYQPTTVEL